MNAPAFDLTAPVECDKHDAFLEAWKQAIRLCGHCGWFGAADEIYLQRATRKDQLQPRIKDIQKHIALIPMSDACLVAAMVSFYNPAEGARLAARIDANGIGAITAPLKPEQRQVLAALIISYPGW